MENISLFKAVILGAIQGATEFLPVSSSAHLVIFQKLLNVDLEAGSIVAFDVCLHIGTLFAVLLGLRKEVQVIIKGLFSPNSFSEQIEGGFSSKNSRYLIWLVILGTIPAVIVGFSFKDLFERLFTSTFAAGIALIITGCILFATRFIKQNNILLNNMKWWRAVVIGIAQSLAIVPGISRSGSTIAAGLFTGLNRALAAKFSFLLSVIAISGAAVLEWENLKFISGSNLLPVILGTVVSFIVGYLCVRWMLVIVKNLKFSWFAIYCWVVGLSAILFS